jgi:hypothetical protein
VTWRERYPEEVTCVRCLRVWEVEDLDRLLWCPECREIARERAGRLGWATGVIAAGLLALWIWIWIRPSNLIVGGWIATVVAALWISARVSREIYYGAMRFRNRKATEARPPELESPG